MTPDMITPVLIALGILVVAIIFSVKEKRQSIKVDDIFDNDFLNYYKQRNDRT